MSRAGVRVLPATFAELLAKVADKQSTGREGLWPAGEVRRISEPGR